MDFIKENNKYQIIMNGLDELNFKPKSVLANQIVNFF